jgi:hypothetical protein
MIDAKWLNVVSEESKAGLVGWMTAVFGRLNGHLSHECLQSYARSFLRVSDPVTAASILNEMLYRTEED